MPFGGLLTVGILGLAGSVTNGILGSEAASSAASEQTQAEEQGLQFQQNVWNQEQQNAAPYLNFGNTSLAALMDEIGKGTFGAGSIPNAPNFTGTFTAPTLAEAEQTPGYQFTAQQGTKGILEGAAAAGGAISGGTLRAEDTFNTGLANSTYNDVFNRSLATYQTGLQGYNANLAAYQANLAKQAQEFGQMFAPVQLGENAMGSLNASGQQAATNVGNLMGNIGNAQAAGTVGSTNALTSAITGGSNSLLQTILLGQLLNGGGFQIPQVGLQDMTNLGMTSTTPTTLPGSTGPNAFQQYLDNLTGAGPGGGPLPPG